MEAYSENKMGTAPMLPLLLSMGLPAMCSMLVQAFYNVVDSYFVAKLGINALTAVSLAFPVQNLMIAVAVGTGVGINSLISRRLGEGRHEEANQAATHGLLLGLISGLAVALCGVIGTDLFFKAFTDIPEVHQMGCDYVYVVTIFSFGMFMQVNMEKTLQSTGNMIIPMFSQLIGAIINIVLDPIMIFGLLGFPAMGVKGAAVATVTGQIIGMLFVVIVGLVCDHAVNISLRGFRWNGRIVRDIYAVGFPSIIMQSIGSAMVMGMNAILTGLNDAAVAVFGIYFKLQSFVFMPVFGMTQGMMPIIGYNYGARNKHRMMSALKIGSIIALVIMAAGTVLFRLAPEALLAIFDADAAMLEVGVPALSTISLCFVPAALGIAFSTLFQAVGMGAKSLFISLLRQLILILPMAYFLSKLGISAVWYAFPLAETISFIASLLIFVSLYRKHIKNLTPLTGGNLSGEGGALN